ncbi:MAG: TolC family protein [Elusimicrobiota bacterium]
MTSSAPSSSNEFISFQAAESLSLQNHPSVRLAQEEAAVAETKRKESRRALFPSLTAKAEDTEGDAVDTLGTPAFTERSYGVEASQALYAGGKLYNTYKQALSTWESLKAKQVKTQSDVLYGVREAAWNLIKSENLLKVYRKAKDDLENEKRMAEQLRSKDVITHEAYLQILSQYNQAIAAVESAEADKEAHVWQWTAALGLQTPPAFRPDLGPISASNDSWTLPECLQWASLQHPDLIIQKKTAEAAYYGHNAARSVYKPIISLNGFYGRSGGAFHSEPLKLSEDWQAGVQISQYFSLSTLNLSGFDQHTSPKIGQSTRTASKTATANVGILDAYRKKAEAQEATLAYHQADVQRLRTEMDVANGVREAYANWKKAIARLKMAENDCPLAQASYSIAKIKSAHREVPLSERAIARNRLAQAEAGLDEAKANYQIAVAALAHAVGATDRFYK